MTGTTQPGKTSALCSSQKNASERNGKEEGDAVRSNPLNQLWPTNLTPWLRTYLMTSLTSAYVYWMAVELYMLAILSISRFSEPYSRQLLFVQLLYVYVSTLDNIGLLLVYKLPLTEFFTEVSVYHFLKIGWLLQKCSGQSRTSRTGSPALGQRTRLLLSTNTLAHLALLTNCPTPSIVPSLLPTPICKGAGCAGTFGCKLWLL